MTLNLYYIVADIEEVTRIGVTDGCFVTNEIAYNKERQFFIYNNFLSIIDFKGKNQKLGNIFTFCGLVEKSKYYFQKQIYFNKNITLFYKYKFLLNLEKNPLNLDLYYNNISYKIHAINNLTHDSILSNTQQLILNSNSSSSSDAYHEYNDNLNLLNYYKDNPIIENFDFTRDNKFLTVYKEDIKNYYVNVKCPYRNVSIRASIPRRKFVTMNRNEIINAKLLEFQIKGKSKKYTWDDKMYICSEDDEYLNIFNLQDINIFNLQDIKFNSSTTNPLITYLKKNQHIKTNLHFKNLFLDLIYKNNYLDLCIYINLFNSENTLQGRYIYTRNVMLLRSRVRNELIENEITYLNLYLKEKNSARFKKYFETFNRFEINNLDHKKNMIRFLLTNEIDKERYERLFLLTVIKNGLIKIDNDYLLFFKKKNIDDY